MKDLPGEILYLIMAVVGGMAKAAQTVLVDGRFVLATAIANVFVAAFSGLMFAFGAEIAGMEGNALLLAAGLGGWLGTEALAILTKKIRK